MIVGAGIHGLSTAWHLATELRERGLGDGGDVLVLDKAHIGAGASGVACGVIRRTGVTVTGMQMANGRVTAVGPWVRDLWSMLDMPQAITVRTPDGRVLPEAPMWTYWALQEGTLDVDPEEFMDNLGEFPPVIHVDSDAPLHDDVDGALYESGELQPTSHSPFPWS